MPAATRAPFERFYGADFGNVRIHDDTAAHSEAGNLEAKAFTHGSNIHFARSKFEPGSGEGQHLLAHELAHVVQGPATAVRREPDPQPGGATDKQAALDQASSESLAKSGLSVSAADASELAQGFPGGFTVAPPMPAVLSLDFGNRLDGLRCEVFRLTPARTPEPGVEAWFFQIGKGRSILVSSIGGGSVLLDAGTGQTTSINAPSVQRLASAIEAVASGPAPVPLTIKVSHADTDHYNALRAVLGRAQFAGTAVEVARQQIEGAGGWTRASLTVQPTQRLIEIDVVGTGAIHVQRTVIDNMELTEYRSVTAHNDLGRTDKVTFNRNRTSPVVVVRDLNTGNRMLFTSDAEGRQFDEIVNAIGDAGMRRLLGAEGGNLKLMEAPHHFGEQAGPNARGMINMLQLAYESGDGSLRLVAQTTQAFATKPSSTYNFLDASGVAPEQIGRDPAGAGRRQATRARGSALARVTVDLAGVQQAIQELQARDTPLRQASARIAELDAMQARLTAMRSGLGGAAPAAIASSLTTSEAEVARIRTDLHTARRTVFDAMRAAAAPEGMRNSVDMTTTIAALGRLGTLTTASEADTARVGSGVVALTEGLANYARLSTNSVRLLQALETGNVTELFAARAEHNDLARAARAELGRAVFAEHVRTAWRAIQAEWPVERFEARTAEMSARFAARERSAEFRALLGEGLDRQRDLNRLVAEAQHAGRQVYGPGGLPKTPASTRVGAGVLAAIEVVRIGLDMFAQYKAGSEAADLREAQTAYQGIAILNWWHRLGVNTTLALAEHGIWKTNKLSIVMREPQDKVRQAAIGASPPKDVPDFTAVVITGLEGEGLRKLIHRAVAELATLEDWNMFVSGFPGGEAFRLFSGLIWGVRIFLEDEGGYGYVPVDDIEPGLNLEMLRLYGELVKAQENVFSSERRSNATYGVKDTAWIFGEDRRVWIYTRGGSPKRIDFDDSRPRFQKIETVHFPWRVEGPMVKVKAVDLMTYNRLSDYFWIEATGESYADETGTHDSVDFGPNVHGYAYVDPDHLIQQKPAESDEPVPRKKADAGDTGFSPSSPDLTGESGQSLPRSIRAPFEQFFGADLESVRVHNDSAAHAAAENLNAKAFSRGSDVYFAKGQFNPGTTEGDRLLAHELTHALQGPSRAELKREPNDSPLPSNAAIYSIGDEVAAAVATGDVSAVVSRLHPRSVIELRAIRDRVSLILFGMKLEQWLLGKIGAAKQAGSGGYYGYSLALVAAQGGQVDPAKRAADGARAEEGLRWLWPALPLVAKLEVYDEGYREIEQAQVDVICHEPSADVEAAWKDPSSNGKLVSTLEKMDAREEYEARRCIDGTTAGLIQIALRMLAREAMDAVADAILELPPGDRERFVRLNYYELYVAFRKKPVFSGNILEYLVGMGRQVRVDHKPFGGSEFDAIVARLLIATEGHTFDDQKGVQTAVDHAVKVLAERQQLYEERRSSKVTEADLDRIDSRLAELKSLDQLFALENNRFVELVANARDDQAAFFADMQRLTPYAPNTSWQNSFTLMIAKKRVKMAGSDADAIRTIILTTQAKAELPTGATPDETRKAQEKATQDLRKEVLATVPYLPPSEYGPVKRAVEGDQFSLMVLQMSQAKNTAQWGTLFSIIIRIARDKALNARYNAQERPTNALGATYTHNQLPADAREIVEAILAEPEKLPLGKILAFTSKVDTLKTVFASMPEGQRARLRKGWALAQGLRTKEGKDEKDAAADAAALAEFRTLEADIQRSQGDDAADYQAVLTAALGTVPSVAESATDEGRYAAGLMMWERIKAGERLEKGVSADFTEADEAMDAAARQFAAMWMPIAERGTNQLAGSELAMLTSFYQLYVERHQDFKEASNSISELAGMIAATVAGIIVIAATGGAATPLVVAAAAASGAGARVITREMFGAEYYRAMSDEGLRDALLGSIDAALVVVSGGLASKGVELVGLGGKALTSGAARVAGEVAEQASMSLSRRVAAGSVEGAIDGLFSGAVSESFAAMTDDNTWRMGIMKGLVQVGHAAVLGGLMGAVGGGVAGGAMPIIGSGIKRVWRGVAGKTFETTIERANQKATLDAARKAAAKGDWKTAYELADQLAIHLDDEEALALREELKKTLSKDASKRPHGTASPQSERQKKLLKESGKSDEPPTGEHLDAERDIVERSAPQPTEQPGYVEEVDLGNGHSWKRKPDGSWCRFTGKAKGCGLIKSEIAERIKGRWHDARDISDRAYDAAAAFPDIKKKLAGAGLEDGKLKLSVLTPKERELFEEAVTSDAVDRLIGKKDIENLTIDDLNRIDKGTEVWDSTLQKKVRRSLPEQEAAMARVAEEAALQRYLSSLTDPYEKLRSASPSPSIRQTVKNRSKGLDEVSGRAPINKQPPDADHVLALRTIWDLDGFQKLHWDDQKAIANDLRNFKAVDSGINRSRQNKSWRSDFSGRNTYTADELKKIIDLEDEMRRELQGEINRRLPGGVKVTP